MTIKLKLLTPTVMKAKSVTSLVGQVEAGDGIIVVKAGGVFTVSVDPGYFDPSDYQPLDADLTALANNSTNGFWARTGAGTGAARTLTGTSNEITVTNGDGSGVPTFSLPSALTFTGKTITGGAFTGGTINNTTIGATTPLTGVFTSLSAASFRGVADLSKYGTSADVQAAVTAAIAAGYSKIFLPAGWTWNPTANTIPADLTVYGESWTTSVIAVGGALVGGFYSGNIVVGARTRIYNCAWGTEFTDKFTTPYNTHKLAPVGAFENIQDVAQNTGVFPWSSWNVMLGNPITLSGNASTDNTVATFGSYSTGGTFYMATYGTGGYSLDIHTEGLGDIGEIISNGGSLSLGVGSHHTGLQIDDYCDGVEAGSYSIRINRYGNPDSLISLSDANATAKTKPFIDIATTAQTTGNLIQVNHSTSTFSGALIYANMNVGGFGSFSGYFLNLINNGTTRCLLDNAGVFTLATWNGVVVAGQYGGTGVANTGKTITLGGNLTTSGAHATTFTTTGTTGVTLPTTGTLATLAGTEELTNKTLNAAVAKGTWTASGTWTIPAVTLNGTVSGGGNQINNVIIGTSTPLAGTFTTLSATTLSTTGDGTIGSGTTGQRFLNVGGGNTNASDGSAILFKNGGSLIGGVGNYSAIIGGAYNADTILYSASGVRIYVQSGQETRFFTTGGVNIGAPTGGDKGSGTLNAATAIYVNNVEVPTTRLQTKTASFTRDLTAASGAVAYTGIGFTPTSIVFISNVNGTTSVGQGFTDSARGMVMWNSATDTANYGSNAVAVVNYTNAAGTTAQSAVLTSYDADGFTLTWTKTGSPTGTLNLRVLCSR